MTNTALTLIEKTMVKPWQAQKETTTYRIGYWKLAQPCCNPYRSTPKTLSSLTVKSSYKTHINRNGAESAQQYLVLPCGPYPRTPICQSAQHPLNQGVTGWMVSHKVSSGVWKVWGLGLFAQGSTRGSIRILQEFCFTCTTLKPYLKGQGT